MNIEQFKQHDLAWSAFEKWSRENSRLAFSYYGKSTAEYEWRYLLADIQHCLDEVGIRAYFMPYHDDDLFRGIVMTKTGNPTFFRKNTWVSEIVDTKFPASTEALTAACLKGFEIWNNNMKEKV